MFNHWASRLLGQGRCLWEGLKSRCTLRALIFWSVFFSATWFYLWRKIVDWDIWWHMAAGRFYWERGYYPPLDTFTFAPFPPGNGAISQIEQIIYGDLLFFFIHSLFGFVGLQCFRILLILFAVITFLRFASFKLNSWTLLGAIAMVLGTMQAHLVKNAIYAMPFLCMVVWLWVATVERRRTLFGALLPLWNIPLFWLWGSMHGTTLVGLAIYFFIIAGHVADRLLFWLRFRFGSDRGRISRETHNPGEESPDTNREWRKVLRLDLVLMLSLFVSMYASYDLNKEKWGFNLDGLIQGAFSSLGDQKTGTPEASTAGAATEPAKEDPFRDKAKRFFRQFWKGGDADVVAEYQYPVDIRYVISAKILFAFAALFTLYAVVALLIYLMALCDVRWALPKAQGLYLSMLLPGVASVYLGMGYLRTIAYAFLVGLPFLAYGLAQMRLSFRHPLLRISRVLAVATVLGCISFVVYQQHAFYFARKFARFSGFIDTEQGWGKTNKFRETVPKYILQHFPGEKLMNSYNIGGYLIWEYYLDKKVFIDNRSAIFPAEYYDDYKNRAGMTYIDKFKIKRGVFSMYVDKDRIAFFMRQNWAPIVFDNSMVIVERVERFDQLYGTIPELIIDEKEVLGMDYVDLMGLGLFVRNTVNYLLLLGRIADGHEFLTRYRFLIDNLGEEYANEINGKRPFVDNMVSIFGKTNHPKLGELCDRIFQGKNDRNHLFIADTCAAFGKAEVAVNEYLIYLKLFPDEDPDAYTRLAGQLVKLGRQTDAVEAMKHAIRRRPENANYYNDLGAILHFSGNSDDAGAMYQKALELKPEDPMIMFNFAVILLEKGQKQDAAKIFMRVLEIKPDHQEAKKHLQALTVSP